MNDCDALLRQVMDQAEALKIPFSRHVSPHVVINRRAVTRYGCCKYKLLGCTIEIAQRVAEGPEEGCLETLAHELLHTCYGCRNHGKRWKHYASEMNEAYGYHISRTMSDEMLGVEPAAREYKYILRCAACGREIKRFRASALVREPEKYRCRCGGALERVR